MNHICKECGIIVDEANFKLHVNIRIIIFKDGKNKMEEDKYI